MPISDVTDCRNSENKCLWTGMIRNHSTRNKRIDTDCRGRFRLRNERPRGILIKGNKNVPGIVYAYRV